MGVGIAHVFASSGIPTVLVDATPELSEAARERASSSSPGSSRQGTSRGTTATAEQHLSAAPSIADAVHGADLVIEAVVERPDVKLAVYAEIEAAAGERRHRDEHVVDPDRGAGGGAAAARTASSACTGSCRRCSSPASRSSAPVDRRAGRRARRRGARRGSARRRSSSGTGPGFVANRIQFAMFREAARIVEEGIATPEQVDEVVRSSFGFRLPFFGPFTIADMAGLDVYADIYETLERGLGPGFSAPAGPARARRPGRVRRQDRARVPRAVAGARRTS